MTIEIQELREAGEDGGDLMGYYSRGHVDRHEFAVAANHYSGADEGFDRRFVSADRTHWLWWRTVPISGEPGFLRFVSAEPRSKGAFAVTVCESVADHDMRATERILGEYQRGYSRGFAEGVNWCLRILEFSNPDIVERLLQIYREREGGK